MALATLCWCGRWAIQPHAGLGSCAVHPAQWALAYYVVGIHASPLHGVLTCPVHLSTYCTAGLSYRTFDMLRCAEPRRVLAQQKSWSAVMCHALQDLRPTSSSGVCCSHLQQQLTAAHTELQHTRALLEQCIQESSAAIKSACAQRSGALRLLLVEQAKELRELEQEKAAAQQQAMDKVSLRIKAFRV